jgi:hypothetical protein
MWQEQLTSVVRTACEMHLKALPGLIAVPTRRFEPVCALLFNSQTVLMAASIFLSDLSQISRITFNFVEHQPVQKCQHGFDSRYVGFFSSHLLLTFSNSQ